MVISVTISILVTICIFIGVAGVIYGTWRLARKIAPNNPFETFMLIFFGTIFSGMIFTMVAQAVYFTWFAV